MKKNKDLIKAELEEILDGWLKWRNNLGKKLDVVNEYSLSENAQTIKAKERYRLFDEDIIPPLIQLLTHMEKES